MDLPENETAHLASERSLFSRVVRGTAAYSALILAGRAASLVLLPVYTRQLATREYGALELIDLTVTLLSTTLGMGVGADTLFYFYSKAEDKKAKSRVAVTLMTLSLLIGVACSLGALAGATFVSQLLLRTTEYAVSIRIAAATFTFGMLLDFGLCYLRATERIRAYSMFTLVRLVASIALNLVFLLVFHLGLNAILLSSLLVTAVLGVVVSILVWREAGEGRGVHFGFLKQAFHFSTPLILSSLCLMTVHYADRYFLSRFVSLGEIGVYAVAYKFGMLVGLLNAPFQMFWRPQMYATVGEKGGAWVQSKTVTYMSMFFIYLAVGYQLLVEYVVRLFVAPAYWEAAQYVPWIGLAYALYAIESQLHNVFLVTARTKLALATSLLAAVVGLAGYWTLIPRYRVWGAVAATLIAFLAMLCLSLYLSLKSMKVAYEYPKLLALVAIGAAIVLARRVAGLQGLPGLAWSVALACAYPAIILALPMFREERRRIASGLRAGLE